MLACSSFYMYHWLSHRYRSYKLSITQQSKSCSNCVQHDHSNESCAKKYSVHGNRKRMCSFSLLKQLSQALIEKVTRHHIVFDQPLEAGVQLGCLLLSAFCGWTPEPHPVLGDKTERYWFSQLRQKESWVSKPGLKEYWVSRPKEKGYWISQPR